MDTVIKYTMFCKALSGGNHPLNGSDDTIFDSYFFSPENLENMAIEVDFGLTLTVWEVSSPCLTANYKIHPGDVKR